MLSPRNNRAGKRLREPFGKAGLTVAVIALVFAMLGGAYAATNDSGKATASAKAKKGPRGPKGPKGDTGPAGPAGPAGAKGDKGDSGAKGDTGPQGKEGPQGKQGIQGKEGSPWTAGSTLPTGKTETGTWTFAVGEGEGPEPISFPIPLAAALGESQVHLIGKSGKELVYNPSAEPTVEEVTPTKCGSALTPLATVENPAAAPGNLCLYITRIGPASIEESGVGSNLITDPADGCILVSCLPINGGPGAGASPAGAVLQILGFSTNGWGTWAVTAP
jgi:Collagen triple helix repeat (20 copies)